MNLPATRGCLFGTRECCKFSAETPDPSMEKIVLREIEKVIWSKKFWNIVLWKKLTLTSISKVNIITKPMSQ